MPRHSNNRTTLHIYPVRIQFDELSKERSYVMKELYDLGIGTQVHYYPIHLQPYYKNLYENDDCAGAWEYYQSVLSLPFHCNLSESDVEHIVHELTRVLDL